MHNLLQGGGLQETPHPKDRLTLEACRKAEGGECVWTSEAKGDFYFLSKLACKEQEGLFCEAKGRVIENVA